MEGVLIQYLLMKDLDSIKSHTGRERGGGRRRGREEKRRRGGEREGRGEGGERERRGGKGRGERDRERERGREKEMEGRTGGKASDGENEPSETESIYSGTPLDGDLRSDSYHISFSFLFSTCC